MLVGRRLPSLCLSTSVGGLIDLQTFSTRLAAIYIYPGVEMSPDGQECSLNADAAQHRAFDAHERDMSTLNLAVIGISSDPPEWQHAPSETGKVRHRLLSDPHFMLARLLGFPTFEHKGLTWYRRLTIIMRYGQIAKVFFPVISPVQNPAQVVAWVRAN
jgi:peroxiredoxin